MDRRLNDGRPVRLEGWSPRLSEQILQRLENVPPGEYQFAIYLNGMRASNVVSVQIDPAFEVAKAPTLRWGAIEPHPLAKQAIPILWVIGPTPVDDSFTNLAIAATPIVVDGLTRTRQVMAISGMIARYPSGQRGYLRLDLQAYAPEIAADAPHDLLIRIGRHESAPYRFDPAAAPLGPAWDATTPKLAIQPLPPPNLTGRITGPDGKPAVGYPVTLAKQGSRQATEYTDDEGRYGFIRVAPGEYSVAAAPPPPEGSPFVSRDGVRVEVGQTTNCDLTFAKEYRISGLVVDENGRPVVKVPINATWNDEASGAEFGSTTDTAADGSFTLQGPFRKVSFVGIATNLWKGAPHHDVKAGDTNVKFVVRKR